MDTQQDQPGVPWALLALTSGIFGGVGLAFHWGISAAFYGLAVILAVVSVRSLLNNQSNGDS